MRPGTSEPVDGAAPRPVRGEPERAYLRFEAAWLSADSVASRPRIQEYLRVIPESEQASAFSDLLALELKCRQHQGEHPVPEDYYPAFPEKVVQIQAIFQAALELGPTSPAASQLLRLEPAALRKREVQHTVSFVASELPPLAEEEEPSPAASGPLTEAPPTPRPPTDSSPTSFAGGLPEVPGYEVLCELGRGGMGVVYKARHLSLRRLVALKMILSDRVPSATGLERFLTEAQAVARFQHPHLVQIYEIGSCAGQPYLSLELLEGGNLHQLIAGSPQPPGAAVRLLETLARAVDHAHQKDIVHRDLKPSNILLTRDGIPKVADFGLAKILDQEGVNLDEGCVVGTPSYMAPEQSWGDSVAVGPAADIYALGVILYELLTGRPPFKTASKSETVQMVRTQEPVPPRQLVPQVARDLELICLKCLQKDLSQRFATAGELAEELCRFREGLPILTRPASWWERFWKWAHRQPAAAALVGVSLVALLTLVLFLDQRARMAHRELREQQRTGELQARVQDLHLQAQEATQQGRLQEARSGLQAAFEIIQAEPALVGLEGPLVALQNDVEHRELELKGQQEAQATHARFFQWRDTALFHGLVFTGVDLPVNVAATREACQKALAIFHLNPQPPRALAENHPQVAGPVFPRYLSAEQRAQCLVGCYELLLIWAEAEAQPEPGRQECDLPQLEAALGLLDQAAGLGLPPTRAFHLRRARYLELLGESDAIEEERQRAAATQPQGALDHFLTGEMHHQQGRLAEAAQAFALALRSEPDHFWARYYLAVCNLQLQQPARACDNLTTCLGTRPDFSALYLYRGFAHGLLNHFRAAEEDYQKALSLKPEPHAEYGIRVNQGVLCLRQAKLAGERWSWSWPLPVTPNLELLGRGGAELYRTERLGAAADFLQQAIRLQPAQYPAYRYLALVLQEQQQLAEAVRVLGQAIETARNRPPALRAQLYGQRARVERARRNLDAALTDLEQAVQIFPTADDHVERGRLLYIRRQYPEAVTAYEAALRLRDQAEVYRWKAEALLALRRENEAVAALDQYLAQGGQPGAEIYRTRGLLRARLRQYPEALADYTQALNLQPDSATHAARGWIFLANEVLPLALQDFTTAIRLERRNAEAHAGSALVRARLGHITSALTEVEAALVHGRPETPRLLWNLAHVYAQLAADAGGPNARLLAARTRYQDLGLEMLRRALERTPPRERAAFWRQYIASDALLNSLRGTDGFERLEREHAVP